MRDFFNPTSSETTFDPAIDPTAGLTSENVEDLGYELNAKAIDAKGYRKAGVVGVVDFTGNPKKYTVTFVTAYANLNYKINISGVDQRSWSYENKTSSGFTINTNANQVLTGEVSWETVVTGE